MCTYQRSQQPEAHGACELFNKLIIEYADIVRLTVLLLHPIVYQILWPLLCEWYFSQIVTIFYFLHFTSLFSWNISICRYRLDSRWSGRESALLRITADGTASLSHIKDSRVYTCCLLPNYYYRGLVHGRAPAAFVGYAMMRTVNWITFGRNSSFWVKEYWTYLVLSFLTEWSRDIHISFLETAPIVKESPLQGHVRLQFQMNFQLSDWLCRETCTTT